MYSRMQQTVYIHRSFSSRLRPAVIFSSGGGAQQRWRGRRRRCFCASSTAAAAAPTHSSSSDSLYSVQLNRPNNVLVPCNQQQQRQQHVEQSHPRRPAAPNNHRSSNSNEHTQLVAAALCVDPAVAAAMLRSYRALASYNPATLGTKAAALSAALGASRSETGRILARAPRVLGRTPADVAARLNALEAALQLQPQPQPREPPHHPGVSPRRVLSARIELRRLLLRLPWLLTLAPERVDARLTRLAAELGAPRADVVAAVRRRPQLLRSANQLPAKLLALGELLFAPDSAGVGAGVGGGSSSSYTYAPTVAAAALALQHPALLCHSPRALRAKFAALQAASGLPAPDVAAAVRADPSVLAADDDALD